jgi:hypothetical protein
MMEYGGVEASSHHSCSRQWMNWVDSFTPAPAALAPGTQRTEHWVWLRGILNTAQNRTLFVPAGNGVTQVQATVRRHTGSVYLLAYSRCAGEGGGRFQCHREGVRMGTGEGRPLVQPRTWQHETKRTSTGRWTRSVSLPATPAASQTELKSSLGSPSSSATHLTGQALLNAFRRFKR